MESSTTTGAGSTVVSAAITPRSTADPALVKVLARLRDERGLSQEQLAHAAGITASAYNRIESASASPGWATVRRLAQALGVSLVELAEAVEAEERR